MKKNISVTTLGKRMNRILTTYHEQVRETENEAPEQSTSTPTFGQMIYSTDRGLEVHKKLLNFAAQDDSDPESDSQSSDESYSLIESPPARNLRSSRTKPRAVKRTAVKVIAAPPKRKLRKVASTKMTTTSTITSASLATNSSATESDDTDNTPLVIRTTKRTVPKRATAIKATPIKASGSFNDNDNRQATK